ncbi:MAG: hypothetical protein ACODAD_14830, partial [Planctomycetota bacterium]
LHLIHHPGKLDGVHFAVCVTSKAIRPTDEGSSGAVELDTTRLVARVKAEKTLRFPVDLQNCRFDAKKEHPRSADRLRSLYQ